MRAPSEKERLRTGGARNKENTMNDKNRLKLTDSTLGAVAKVAEANPGAITVACEVLCRAEAIDPDDAFGGMGVILTLDGLGIYGPRIWMFYKDVCKQNLVSMLGILRAHQLGYLSEESLNQAIDNYGDGVDVEVLVAKVKEYLPRFGHEEATP